VQRQPVGEPLVQHGPLRLRQCVVGGVPDEEMPEPKCFLVGKRGDTRPHELLPHEPEQPRRYIQIVGCQCSDRPAVEHLALDGATLERRTLPSRELVEPCCEQRLDRRRHRDFPRRFLEHREHLLDEQRVAVGRSPDAAAEVRVEPCSGK
jgi:hypothetical protein